MEPAKMIRTDRLISRLEELSRAGGMPGGGVSRFPYSKEHVQAVRLVAGWMEEAGLAPGCDGIGNLIGEIAGSHAFDGWPVIVLGSHLDTVPSGGKFDGALGVVAAVEVAQALRDAGCVLGHTLAIVGFADEEGHAFGMGTLASRLAVGDLTPERCKGLIGCDGRTLGEATRAFSPGLVAAFIPRRIGAYLELHVEQGPLLWRSGWRVAAVDTITGIAKTTVNLVGEANHAGTTPMSDRRDALAGAAEFVLAVRALAQEAGPPAVGTVGALLVRPGASNVVPGEVELKVEFRSTDGAQLVLLCDQARSGLQAIAMRTGLRCCMGPWDLREPVPLDAGIRDSLFAAMTGAGIEPHIASSGAGHDAMVLAKHVPAGMLFVPSVGGVSHSPRELTRPEDAALGAEVLLRAVLLLDGRGPLHAGLLPTCATAPAEQ